MRSACLQSLESLGPVEVTLHEPRRTPSGYMAGAEVRTAYGTLHVAASGTPELVEFAHELASYAGECCERVGACGRGACVSDPSVGSLLGDVAEGIGDAAESAYDAAKSIAGKAADLAGKAYGVASGIVEKVIEITKTKEFQAIMAVARFVPPAAPYVQALDEAALAYNSLQRGRAILKGLADGDVRAALAIAQDGLLEAAATDPRGAALLQGLSEAQKVQRIAQAKGNLAGLRTALSEGALLGKTGTDRKKAEAMLGALIRSAQSAPPPPPPTGGSSARRAAPPPPPPPPKRGSDPVADILGGGRSTLPPTGPVDPYGAPPPRAPAPRPRPTAEQQASLESFLRNR